MTALENIEVALAIETLAYHDKNYLDSTIAGSNARRSELMQELLGDAVKEMGQKTVVSSCGTDNEKEHMVIDIQGDGHMNHLLNMLAWIELLGGVGHSASFKVFADGDGLTRWKFKFKNTEQQKKYDALKKELLNANINTHKDLECFEI